MLQNNNSSKFVVDGSFSKRQVQQNLAGKAKFKQKPADVVHAEIFVRHNARLFVCLVGRAQVFVQSSYVRAQVFVQSSNFRAKIIRRRHLE